MKKNLLFLAALILCTVFVSPSCKKNSSPTPCNGVGTIWFENKRDSLLIINIVQSHITINLLHDETQNQAFSGGIIYTIRYSGPAYTGNLKDTNILVQNCDNNLVIIKPPAKK